ncbi:ATP-dependent nuclease [Roseixanthobacter liquoris]|uniref:ATP-dependent nuclease n=1 Tax=Roseixanthobacter liquoris TaxID=3119921 RepID=UPI00372A3099
MFISEIRIENFRLFGSGERTFVLPLNPGLTALVGENDAGKTAVIDAIRFVLGTRDQEVLRVEPTDFHQPAGGGERVDQIVIKLTFRGLTSADRGAFAEFLTYEQVNGKTDTSLIVMWVAKRNTKESTSRRVLPAEWRTGVSGEGPLLDLGARSLLTATYLRPLRDAERAMSAGRGSRLSQILQHTKEIKETGVAFDRGNEPNPDPRKLSVLGLGDYAGYLFGESDGIKETRKKLNDEYLKPLSFANDMLNARIGVSGSQDDAIRLRQLLEKLEVTLAAFENEESAHARGLGSNNLLFMACELLLLAAESDGFPLLLIEEPEAHLHPQRQLRLMSFLQEQAEKVRPDGQQIQIIVTTHSPNLASDLRLNNLALIEGGRAFPLCEGKTKLSKSDYRFLERFLDVTKANLFFARAVLIVEGDAENILLPVIARLLGRDFHHYGVSMVNVGGVGLGRYARIFMREDPQKDGVINIPVACITDMDVMPDNAPWIVGKLKQNEIIPPRPPSRRQWRVKGDFPGDGLEARRKERKEKASGQRVETFVADEWTLEYDLAFFGLRGPVWYAACLALDDDNVQAGKVSQEDVIKACGSDFKTLVAQKLDRPTFATHVYAKFEDEGASKAVAAQYLAGQLEKLVEKGKLDAAGLLKRLPPYVISAIEHVTAPLPKSDEASEAEAAEEVN